MALFGLVCTKQKICFLHRSPSKVKLTLTRVQAFLSVDLHYKTGVSAETVTFCVPKSCWSTKLCKERCRAWLQTGMLEVPATFPQPDEVHREQQHKLLQSFARSLLPFIGSMHKLHHGCSAN